MAKTGIYVGLDIGTTSVKVVVAEYVDSQMNIIGVGNAKSEGINRGIIVDIEKTVQAIKRAVGQAEEKAGIQIRTVNVGIPANLLEVENCQGMIAVNNESKEITNEDVRNVASAALVRSVPPERQIIAVLPQEFTVDGFEGIKDPRGMIGVRLEMYGVMFTGPKTIIHNIRKCVEKAGLTIGQTIITPLALTESILSDGEKDFGTIVIDIGGGQTTTAVMHDKQLKFTNVNQEGGEYVTRDISTVLNTSFNNAEALKINYGDAYPARTSASEEFPVDVIGKAEPVKIDERYLSEIIEARMEQIFTKAKDVLDEIDALDLPGGVVLTGGAASLPGLVDLAQEILGTPVKLHVPNHMGLRNPVFTNVISLVDYAASMSEITQVVVSAITGERVVPTTSSTPAVQTPVVPDEEPEYEQPTYETNANYYDEEEHQEKVTDKIKNFFSNFFE
ncbi:cell division protein FtsA [Enterococcus cecorum]|uniref:Cell division protein FtsA n=1 Tax=Enterococcus cecorum DSM 20682 = ATCC 43198 TaxID=1121864 RepID=S1QZW1_9ENTE|nr:cell division protein FtsA [Enterococcus cecorum]EOX19291.1 cell division protein ftsA [Enterococcus cecorum DSM 20682 = ATCC 43198]ESK62049.1 cell division protein ftsA [Enterococcus cecorum DSM 20682 = ATCC 43198]OJG34224.1 cell division protein ftsA [Enterococcus cecorum DSM 20682 = ATCC 43198]CAI3327828.1 cell division protein FtsA [Enterococcus cecorum DSM 20682 = ATCC 43198]SQE56104.1 cell division protein ftsA [Enterococcus cecorum]